MSYPTSVQPEAIRRCPRCGTGTPGARYSDGTCPPCDAALDLEVAEEEAARNVPRKGDWVEVTVRGPIWTTIPDGTFVLGRIGQGVSIEPSADYVVSVTKIEPPDPVCLVGTLVQDARGLPFRRVEPNEKNLVWQDFTGMKHPEHGPRRPLRRLVPEGGAE